MHSNDILKQLEAALNEQLEPHKARKPEGSQEEWDRFILSVRAMCEDLRSALFESITTQVSMEAKQVLVSDYVRYIANVCQSLKDYGKKASAHLPKSRLDNYKHDLRHICDEIAEVMTFVERQYQKYFDYDVVMPYSLVLKKRTSFRHAIDKLAPIYKLEGVDPVLVDIALAPVRQLLKSSENITYRQFRYLRRIVDKLATLLTTQVKNPELEVHRILQSINFNHEQYIQYCKARLAEKYPALNDSIDYLLEDQESRGVEKRERLYNYPNLLRIYRWYLKEQNQVDVEAGMYWAKDADSVVVQLNRNINEEIKFITDQVQLDEGYVNGIKLFSSAPKISLALSSPKGAAWLWSAKEAGIFNFKDNNEAVSQFCAHFSTTGAEDLSPISFRSNFYNISSAAAGGTMDLVHKQKEMLREKIG